MALHFYTGSSENDFSSSGNSVVFLDFDGVIRVSGDDGHPQFCEERMQMVASACSASGSTVVITSDWRHMESRDEIAELVSPHIAPLLHDDWATPVCGHRWNEVQAWLASHPEVVAYGILEDFVGHFDGCPEAMRDRIVWCPTKTGINPALALCLAKIINLTK